MKDENAIRPSTSDILQTLISIINDNLEETNSKLNDFENALNDVIEAISEHQGE
jgi:tRNA(Phe) wybutosine-synthesizing methylase Tyw3